MLKKLSIINLAFWTVLVAGSLAIAGQVYDRATQAITSGTGTWTNTKQYAALELKRIWIDGNTSAGGTVSVSRVTADLAYTQTVGSIVCTTGDGSTASFTAAYLKPSDMLVFTEAHGSNATAIIEYEVQQH